MVFGCPPSYPSYIFRRVTFLRRRVEIHFLKTLMKALILGDISSRFTPLVAMVGPLLNRRQDSLEENMRDLRGKPAPRSEGRKPLIFLIEDDDKYCREKSRPGHCILEPHLFRFKIQHAVRVAGCGDD